MTDDTIEELRALLGTANDHIGSYIRMTVELYGRVEALTDCEQQIKLDYGALVDLLTKLKHDLTQSAQCLADSEQLARALAYLSSRHVTSDDLSILAHCRDKKGDWATVVDALPLGNTLDQIMRLDPKQLDGIMLSVYKLVTYERTNKISLASVLDRQDKMNR